MPYPLSRLAYEGRDGRRDGSRIREGALCRRSVRPSEFDASKGYGVTSLLDKAMDALVVPGFSKIGYKVRQRAWEPITANLNDRTVVVTGATSGIGRAAATELARLGARLIIVGRNPEKTEGVRAEMIDQSGNPDIRFEIADLSLMAEVRGLAARLIEAEPEIHVLVNNAGVLFPERGETTEGVEQTLATNLLGHFLLTNLLIPRLIESQPSRIINVSSGGMYSQRISVSNLQSDRGDYKGAAAYARTKRGQVILTEMWAEQLSEHGVTVNAMHPGWADTPGVVSSLPLFHKLTAPVLRSPEEAADTIVWLAASDDAAGETGQFWHDRQPRPTHKTDRTRAKPGTRERLWQALSDLAETSAGT